MEIAVGGLGVAWGLSLLATLRERLASPVQHFNAWGILVFGLALVAFGGLCWLGLLQLT